MDESRKQFEEVVTGRAEDSGYFHMNNLLKRDGNGYSTAWVDMMWEGWQASMKVMAVKSAIEVIGGVQASMYLYQAAAARTIHAKQDFICRAINELKVKGA